MIHFLDSKIFGLMLFGPGVRFVPENVWRSKFFWIALLVMIVGSIVYKNNFFNKTRNGNPILTGKGDPNAAKISYSSDGRSGHVQYQSAEASFALYYEFGGGDCVVTIAVPGQEDWQKHTGFPLERREEVLNIIGQRVVKDQTTGGAGYFKIEDNALNIYV